MLYLNRSLFVKDYPESENWFDLDITKSISLIEPCDRPIIETPLKADVTQWLNEHAPGKWYPWELFNEVPNPSFPGQCKYSAFISFAQHSTALLFKLTWF